MKRADLERRLRKLGWTFLRHGGKHDVWTNGTGTATEYVPRHAEVHERLARKILDNARRKQ